MNPGATDGLLAPAWLDERRYRFALGLIVTISLLFQVSYVVAGRGDDQPHGDGRWYHLTANAIPEGHFFANPYLVEAGADLDHARDLPIYDSAQHPPLYPLYLAAFSAIGADSPLAHRVATALVGAAIVLLAGVLGRQLAGRRAGLVVAALSAAYPHLWINSATLHSEALYALCIVAVLIASYRFARVPTLAGATLLGAAVAIAGLARPEAPLLYAFLVLPLVVTARSRSTKERFALLCAAGLAGMTILGPWVLFNLARFNEPTFMTTGTGAVLAQGNCDTTYSGAALGYWDIRCFGTVTPDCVCTTSVSDCRSEGCYLGDESEFSAIGYEVGMEYIREHLGRLPVVVAARVGRMWSLYRPFEGVKLDTNFEKRGRVPSMAGLAMLWAMLPLSVYGAIQLRRRSQTVIPFVALVLSASLTAGLAMGITRYRVAGDVAVVVLAGIALDHLASRLEWRRRRTEQP